MILDLLAQFYFRQNLIFVQSIYTKHKIIIKKASFLIHIVCSSVNSATSLFDYRNNTYVYYDVTMT